MTDGDSTMSLLVSRKERGTVLEGSHLLKTTSPSLWTAWRPTPGHALPHACLVHVTPGHALPPVCLVHVHRGLRHIQGSMEACTALWLQQRPQPTAA